MIWKSTKALSWTKLSDLAAGTFEKVRTIDGNRFVNWEYIVGQFLGQYAQWSQTMEYLTDSMKDILNTESIETVQSLFNKGCNYAHTGSDYLNIGLVSSKISSVNTLTYIIVDPSKRKRLECHSWSASSCCWTRQDCFFGSMWAIL